ncbi:MAG: glycosyltransferase family 39 protein, partial [Limnobacter sp.]|nr:glycosyltransferase family 39 protein [Limnobacter sp.]
MSQTMTNQAARRVFWMTVWITALVKVWLAAYFPMTSDEAFFHEWANHLSYGYYDHPPMIGWWLWLLTRIGDEPLIMRSLTVLLTTVVAYGVVVLCRRLSPVPDESKAWLAGAVYLSLPVSWYGVFVTTDTPLIFFMSVSVLIYVLAIRSQSVAGVFWAGVFLGLAFLSKYFAVLLGFAFGFHILLQPRRFAYGFALLAGTLPFVGVNVIYNAYHCWNNIMFNLVNRHDDAQLSWTTVAGYLGMMLYVLTPWVLYVFLRGAKAFRGQGALQAVLWVPLGLFLVISLEKTVGLHW